MDKEGIIIIKDSESNEIKCDILFTFDSEEYNKSYIVYTDNTKDELGNIKVYANTYDKDSDNGNLGIIESDEEISVIEQILANVTNKEEV